MKVGNVDIGPSFKPYIIAELGAGWVQPDHVLRMLVSAKDAGVSAVKIQVYKPEDLTLDCNRPEYIPADTPWKSKTLWEVYQRGSLPEESIPAFFEEARRMGITLFASVFSPRVIPMLEQLGCPAYKIASAEVNYRQLLFAVNGTGKPVFLSTGMASISEVYQAWGALDDAVVMHCVSGYPVPIEQANLGRITELRRNFETSRVGFSDHTLGEVAAGAAVALGACAVEKHIALPGSLDGGFGLRPYELHTYVKHVNDAWAALQPDLTKLAEEPIKRLRRSIRATAAIKKGDRLDDSNMGVLRPNGGADPFLYALVVGSKAARDIEFGEAITEMDWEG